MVSRPYLLISGIVFGVVAVAHLLRVVNGWALELGPWSVPMWLSWVGSIGPAALSAWAFRLAGKR